MAGEVGFWGGSTDADLRAARAFAAVQHLLGPGAVVTPRLQGGRSPAERARFVTWTAPAERTPTGGVPAGGGSSNLVTADPDPWPGRIPPPAPAVVHPTPLDAELADPAGKAVEVSGRGLLTTTPDRLSVAGGPWAPVDAWAGPWPADERWWSRSRRRAARLQAVTGPAAYLLVAERGRWWVEATYG
jgi:protein ImuB